VAGIAGVDPSRGSDGAITPTDPKATVNLGPRDAAVIAGQLGRPPRDLTGVAARCPFGYPAVIETAPILEDGSPNPTLLYLTCPTLVTAVSRAEAAGGVRAFKSACRTDDGLRTLLAEITCVYRKRRAALLRMPGREGPGRKEGSDPRLDAGIGGPETPDVASCLHAYAAAFLAVMSGWVTPGDRGASSGVAAESVRKAWAAHLPPLDSSWCSGGLCTKWAPGERRAAIDVGTISVRLLVADLVSGRPVAVLRRAEVTRLGEGLVPGGPLSEAARRRTAAAVARFAQEARRYGAQSIVLAGTSAAREAADGGEFIATLGRDHDLHAMVLSGGREATLAYRGASLDVADSPLVLDVGGGSSELTLGSAGGAVRAVSLPLGAGRSTDRWIRSDPPVPEEIAAVREEAARLFAEIRGDFERGSTERRLVGVAGTVTTLAALDLGLEAYDAAIVHLHTLSLDVVRGLVARLRAMTTEERAALPCMQAGRAPVIVAGAVIVMAAMETLGYDELTVSECDLLDGLVLEEPH